MTIVASMKKMMMIMMDSTKTATLSSRSKTTATTTKRVTNTSWMMFFILSLLLLVSSTNKIMVQALAVASSMPPLVSENIAESLPLAQTAMNYFDSSPDPFHAVQTSVDLLTEAGFEELKDTEPYSGKIQPGGKYYFTRNKSTVVAFAVGEKYVAGNGGFKVIGGHTDSPNLKVKPRSKRSNSKKVLQLGVECYGGGLWHTWFDRDLGISGRVLVNDSSTNKITQHLVKIDRALLRIPNLAIHLQTADERKAFAINKEDHLSPILAMAVEKALTTGDSSSSTGGEGKNDDEEKSNNNDKDGWTEYQEPLLLKVLATELNVNEKDIIDFELNLFDIQKASLGGVYSEFIHSARLDNLASCYLAVQGLVNYVQSESNLLASDKDISMVVLYDHEEVGSESAVGAASPIMGEAVKRISSALYQQEESKASLVDIQEATIRKSFVLSVDQAHALHPNYISKHEKNHQPLMNQGMVIKRNANQRYATTGITGLIVRQIASRSSILSNLPPIQEFIVRQDCGCGSTIGPIISTATGIRTIDMGCPQLSMHSIRETMGVCDLTHGLALFEAFFEFFREVDESIEQ